MIKNCVLAVLIAMTSAAVLVACGGGGGGEPPALPLVVDVYGDSIMAGYGVRVSPVARIREARPGWQLVDHSAPGTPLKALMPGFATAPRAGQVVVIGNGFVDAFQGLDGYALDLRAAVLQILAERRVPVLTGIVGTPLQPPMAAPYNAVTHAIAAEFGLQHAGWGEAYRDGDAAADGIHRTQEASDRLAVLLADAIERAADQTKK